MFLHTAIMIPLVVTKKGNFACTWPMEETVNSPRLSYGEVQPREMEDGLEKEDVLEKGSRKLEG